jgi:TRAP-type C4-dicarboxylate transport system substrate-binding protein
MSEQLNKFVREVLNIDAKVPGTGVSYAGFTGASSPRQQAIEDLKRKTLEFAAEHNKKDPNKEVFLKLSQEVEGNIQGLHALAVLDDSRLNNLLDGLHSLTT